jgi:transposase
MGPSGRRILTAIIAGETDAEKLAALGSERLGCGRAALSEAPKGRIREHHRFLFAQHLRTIEQLEESVAAFDARIAGALAPFRDVVERLNEVPGLGICDRDHHRRNRDRYEPLSDCRTSCLLQDWLRALMRALASAAQLELGTALPGLNLRSCKLAGRQRAKRTRTYRRNFCASNLAEGRKKALIAVAGSILTIVYRMLRDGTFYRDLGPEYFARRSPAKLANRIRNLGYHVEISTAT